MTAQCCIRVVYWISLGFIHQDIRKINVLGEFIVNVAVKYFQGATCVGQLCEFDRIRKHGNFSNREMVRFLKESQLSRKLPIIISCDHFNRA